MGHCKCDWPCNLLHQSIKTMQSFATNKNGFILDETHFHILGISCQLVEIIYILACCRLTMQGSDMFAEQVAQASASCSADAQTNACCSQQILQEGQCQYKQHS